jgi:hypothetical protein
MNIASTWAGGGFGTVHSPRRREAAPLAGRFDKGAGGASSSLPTEGPDMPKTENVSWTQIATLIGLMIAVIGGGFVWLHSDMDGIKSNIVGLTNQVSEIRGEVGKTTGKLEIVVQELQKRR